MPRNRTARLAVLGSSAQRSSAATYSPRVGRALKRRLIVGVLVLVSLALITVYFRESAGGGVHGLQSAGAGVLRPFEVGAERVARPFRDAAGWVGGLFHAKSESARLRVEVDRLRQQVIQNESALRENAALRSLLDYAAGPTFPRDYRPVAAAVISRAPSQFVQEIGIAAGSRRGVRLHDPVVTADGLVGQVTRVTPDTAQVTLLTDETSAVSAIDLQTGSAGVVRHGGARDSLILDRVTKDQIVSAGDQIVTSGWRSGRLASIYPKGIPIGKATSVGQTDTDLYKQIQVRPFVDSSSLDAVLVLVKGSR